MYRSQAGSLRADLRSDEGCPRQVLRRRHQQEEEAVAETGQGQEAHEVYGQGQRAARGLHGSHTDQRLSAVLSEWMRERDNR